MRRVLSPFALCLVVGACAMPGRPGSSPTAFDGTYQGTMTSLNASSNSCSAAASQPQMLVVENGTVAWTSGGTKYFAPVGKDGAFAAQNGGQFFSGKITDRALVARVNTGSCHQIFDLARAA